MNKILLSIAAAAALALTVPAFAQKAEAPKTPIPKDTFFVGQGKTQYLARQRLLGQKVAGKDGQTIGDIEDLIVNDANQVVGVIMGVGGVLGVGEKKIGVQFKALKFDSKDGKTTVSLPTATKEVLAALEPYKRTEPDKTLMQKASDAAKSAVDKAKEAAGMKTEEKK